MRTILSFSQFLMLSDYFKLKLFKNFKLNLVKIKKILRYEKCNYQYLKYRK